MKKTLLVALLTVFSVLNANAAELKEGSLYCVSSKKIIAYYDFVERGREDFAQKLLDKSDCYFKKKPIEVYIKSEQKKYTEVELLSGFTVWTKNENITH
jgi:hypothetical protein